MRGGPYGHKVHLLNKGVVHLVDRYIGFGGEWRMFCDERIHLDANAFTKYGVHVEVNCMGCIVAEGETRYAP